MVILGATGAGKSQLALELAQVTGIAFAANTFGFCNFCYDKKKPRNLGWTNVAKKYSRIYSEDLLWFVAFYQK